MYRLFRGQCAGHLMMYSAPAHPNCTFLIHANEMRCPTTITWHHDPFERALARALGAFELVGSKDVTLPLPSGGSAVLERGLITSAIVGLCAATELSLSTRSLFNRASLEAVQACFSGVLDGLLSAGYNIIRSSPSTDLDSSGQAELCGTVFSQLPGTTFSQSAKPTKAAHTRINSSSRPNLTASDFSPDVTLEAFVEEEMAVFVCNCELHLELRNIQDTKKSLQQNKTASRLFSIKPPSIEIYLLDDISRFQFQYYMPKTVRWMQQLPPDLLALQFPYYNQLGWGTFDNLPSLLKGCGPRSRSHEQGELVCQDSIFEHFHDNLGIHIFIYLQDCYFVFTVSDCHCRVYGCCEHHLP